MYIYICVERATGTRTLISNLRTYDEKGPMPASSSSAGIVHLDSAFTGERTPIRDSKRRKKKTVSQRKIRSVHYLHDLSRRAILEN